MFTEKEMAKALTWLFDLYQPQDYEIFDEEALGKYCGLCINEVCMALRSNAQTVYQYTVQGNHEHSFNYRGKELFGQRGCKLYSDVELGVSDNFITTYNKELWLLEDSSFVIVRCVSMKMESGSCAYETEYRSIVKQVEGNEDLFSMPEELFSVLEEMCTPQWEQRATIYEL